MRIDTIRGPTFEPLQSRPDDEIIIDARRAVQSTSENNRENIMNKFHRIVLGYSCTLGIVASALAANNEKRLIVHSDDAGMCHSVNTALIDGMEKGIVTSASIMVPCPWFDEIAEYARKHPEKDWGIHLTLTCEWDSYQWGPVAGRNKVPSLCDEKGYLWDNTRLVRENAKPEEVEIELRAQIDRALKYGIKLSHLDTHMGAVLARPEFAETYARLGVEYNLPVLFVRMPKAILESEYPGLAKQADKIVAMLKAKKLPILDFLEGDNYSIPKDQKKGYFLHTLEKIPSGLSQIIIHCGYATEELKSITTSAERREADARSFMDPEVIAAVKKQGITLTTWREAHEAVAGDTGGNK